MRFSQDLLDEIRARLPVSQVVSRHVRLKRAGREFIGLSPFKQEKTPSFTVNDEKGFYHCFASGEHGSIFDFVMAVEGLSFPESVEKLAAEAGVDLPKASPETRRQEDRRRRLLELMEAACGYFEKALQSPDGLSARAYLERRGLDVATIAGFRIGYAPAGRDRLKGFLRHRGFSEEEIVATGMCIAGQDIAVPYDRFRDRIMFPIKNQKGAIVAFGGRALQSSQKAKYLNSPETPLFHKGHLLYNLADARQTAHDRGAMIVVEGYMDVIASSRAGFANAVAPLGTALTEAQLQLMWRVVREPVLCFDGDEAGRKAAWRAIDTALPQLKPGHSLRFAFLPAGMDPDDLIKSEGGQAFEAVIERALPLVEVLWQRELATAPTDTPERRADLEARLYEEVARIAHGGVNAQYRNEVRQRLWEHWRSGRDSDRRTNHRQSTHSIRNNRTTSLVLPRSREMLVLAALLTHPWLLDDYSEEVAALDFEDGDLARLRDGILQAQIANSGQNALDTEGLGVHLMEVGFGDVLERLGAAHSRVEKWMRQSDMPRRDVETSWRQLLDIHQTSQALQRQLRHAERAFLEEASEENFGKVKDLNARILERFNLSAGSDGEMRGGQGLDEFLAAKLREHGLD